MADYLKLPELARRLDVSQPTARRMVKSGKLPSVFVGGAYRVNEEDLKKYLEDARVRPGGDSPKALAPKPPLDNPADKASGADDWAESYAELGESLLKQWRHDVKGWESTHKLASRDRAIKPGLPQMSRTLYLRWALSTIDASLNYAKVAHDRLEHQESLTDYGKIVEVSGEMIRLSGDLRDRAYALMPDSEEDYDTEIREFRKQLDELDAPGSLASLPENTKT